MRRTVPLVVVTFIILGIASSAYAKFWGWEIDWLKWEYKYENWRCLTAVPNPNPSPQTVSYTHSETRYVSINACAGLADVVEAKIGYERGYSVTDSVTITLTLPAYRTVYWEKRWKYKYYCGGATEYKFWTPVRHSRWSAVVPVTLYLRGRIGY